MIKRKIISIFLLCLLLMVNWHNSFLHSHTESTKGHFSIVHNHDHSHFDHQHNINDELAMWDWIEQFLGNFEHPCLGEKHLEIFLKAKTQIGIDISSLSISQISYLVLDSHFSLSDQNISKKKRLLNSAFAFYNPPFFDSINPRGPPQFS